MQNEGQIGIHGGKMADISEKCDVNFANGLKCKILVMKTSAEDIEKYT